MLSAALAEGAAQVSASSVRQAKTATATRCPCPRIIRLNTVASTYSVARLVYMAISGGLSDRCFPCKAAVRKTPSVDSEPDFVGYNQRFQTDPPLARELSEGGQDRTRPRLRRSVGRFVPVPPRLPR
jgi:hypothetical protein